MVGAGGGAAADGDGGDRDGGGVPLVAGYGDGHEKNRVGMSTDIQAEDGDNNVN